eukprot:SAG22_NODE_7824_length_704_cov_1.938843_1_plen_94_part_00
MLSPYALDTQAKLILHEQRVDTLYQPAVCDKLSACDIVHHREHLFVLGRPVVHNLLVSYGISIPLPKLCWYFGIISDVRDGHAMVGPGAHQTR